uniref:Integrase catalytic domain-containing protein n=1 Tax=Physcomitrium patens TaxID=3218 RepID=A0A2K1ITV4_PHYPA|nr:hypothetical protein PHYPA_024656 [Physcomitrium patens]
MAAGIPYLLVHQEICTHYQHGKQACTSLLWKSETRAQETLELIHINICGPFPTTSLKGSNYILVIVDDHSRFTWVSNSRAALLESYSHKEPTPPRY